MQSQGKSSKNHEQNRHSMCLICKRKPQKQYFKTTGAIGAQIKLLFPDFNEKDSRLPDVVCCACRHKIIRASANASLKGSLQMPDYSKYHFKIKTRTSVSEKECECTLCNEIRSRQGNLDAVNAKKKSKSLKTTTTNSRRCSKCLTLIAKGVSHKCYATSTLTNIHECVQSPKQAEQLLSGLLKKNILKDKLNVKEGSTTIPASLSQQHGKPLDLLINANPKKVVRQISSNDLCELQTDLNLSNRQVKNVSKFIRKKTSTRDIIEPYAQEKFVFTSHNLDDFFEVQSFDFETTKKDVMTKATNFAVVCVDLMLFVRHIIDKREIFDFHLNFGLDGGGGSLKFTLSIQSSQENDDLNQKTKKNSEKWKDTGVKKIFIIALAPDTQENYNNVKLLWSKLEINKCLIEYPGTVTTDLKLANIITGLTSNASFCPCIWCDVTKSDLSSCGTLRTTASCLSNYNNWCHQGSVKNKVKDFKNCIHPPLFCSDKDQLILDVIPPPELHLLLGCVNTLYSSMLKLHPNIAEKWAQECHVQKSCTNGGNFSFEGNACKILLNNVDKLQRLCEVNFGGLSGCIAYVDTFRKFKTVVDDCFSFKLRPKLQQHVTEFQKSYELLGISVTPKVHTIYNHVPQFCSKFQKGLGFFAEQATESVHHDFNEKWKNFKVAKINENYFAKLLRAVRSYNSTHI